MLYRIVFAVGAMALLVLAFGAFHVLAARVRAVHEGRPGDCPGDSVRCLGCYVSGRCKSLQRANGGTGAPPPHARGRPPGRRAGR